MKKFIFSTMILVACFVSAQAQRKAVSILGDSYSTFQYYLTPDTNYVWYFARPDAKRTDVASVRQTWWYKFISENGFKLCVNNSFSGSTICNTGYRNEDYSDRSFITRMDYLGCPDMILIFGCTNDCWAKSPVGQYKYDKWSDTDLCSFRPAMAKMLAHITERYINTEVYFILNSDMRDDIVESCRTICQHYGVPCIELKAIDKMNGHPTVKGMSQIAQQLKDAIIKK
jgi:hypothetical protein